MSELAHLHTGMEQVFQTMDDLQYLDRRAALHVAEYVAKFEKLYAMEPSYEDRANNRKAFFEGVKLCAAAEPYRRAITHDAGIVGADASGLDPEFAPGYQAAGVN